MRLLHRMGTPDFFLQGVLKNFVFRWEMYSIIDLDKGDLPLIADISLRCQGSALIDQGIIAVLAIIKVEPRFLRQIELPPVVDQLGPIVLIAPNTGEQLVTVQIVRQIDKVLQISTVFTMLHRSGKFAPFFCRKVL